MPSRNDHILLGRLGRFLGGDMAITLEDGWLKHVKKAGSDSFELVAGQTLKIETSPDGEEILVAVVPAGTRWIVSVIVDIQEIEI